jgi:ABC-type oligopeptide transport system ATPase subunit
VTILRCEDVKKYFSTPFGCVKAVDGVSFAVKKGTVFGIVGESGCGKTTLGRIVLGMLKPDSGRVTLGTDRLQAVFQDPYNSLDPKMRVKDIISEGLRVRRSSFVVRRSPDENERIEKVIDLVRLPKDALRKYPHQFSGGERQRIAIARAVVTEPDLIVCDEPVSSLDVTVQLDILRLLKDIQKRSGVTYLFISHDLRVIRFMCDTLAVMRAGRIIESADTNKIYSRPSEPYTKALLSCGLYDSIEGAWTTITRKA